MITIKTNHPIAYESPDHILATESGTSRDNSTSNVFIDEVETFFKSNFNLDKIKVLDLGCSGGQLTIDFHNKNHVSVGLEGSDYSVRHQRANWPEWHNKILFTCDVTKPYELYKEKEKIKFNLITAWEVIEHIHPNDLKNFFKHISDNLEENGLFVGSISTNPDDHDPPIHQSVFSVQEWHRRLQNEIITDINLNMYMYPFSSFVRGDAGSFHVCFKKETK